MTIPLTITHSLPAAAKFVPTDEELVGHYLYSYINGYLTPIQCYPVQESDLYGEKEPWELWKDHQIGSHPEPQDAVYLFTKLKKKSGNSTKYFDRGIGTAGGSWHGEDAETECSRFTGRDGLVWAAKKRTLKYRNLRSEKENGKWLLYEFRLCRVGSSPIETVLCTLKNNGSPTAAEMESGNKIRKRKLEDILEEFRGPVFKKVRCDRKQGNSDENGTAAFEVCSDAIVPVQNETAAFEGSTGLMEETAPLSGVLEEDSNLGNLTTFTLEELFGCSSEELVQVAPLILSQETASSGVDPNLHRVAAEKKDETAPLEVDPNLRCIAEEKKEETAAFGVDHSEDPALDSFAFFLEEQLESSDVVSNVNEEEARNDDVGSMKTIVECTEGDNDCSRMGDSLWDSDDWLLPLPFFS